MNHNILLTKKIVVLCILVIGYITGASGRKKSIIKEKIDSLHAIYNFDTNR